MDIIQADALNMPLRDCSVDAIVTDPPYGLEFMGKEWDKLTRNLMRPENEADIKRRKKYGKNYQGRRSNLPDILGSQKYAYQMQLWHAQWLIEAYRVLKPGGSMLVMGGTRTFHRLMCAIEDSGFIIKDTLAWNYGSGFPKAQALSTGLTDRFLQVSLQGVFHWKNKALNFQSDYQENCCLCGEPLQISLAVFLNADSIEVDVPERNHLSLREFSIPQDNGHKNKVSVSSVFSPLAMQDFSLLAFSLSKDAFAQVSKLGEIVPILVDGNLPSSKLLLSILYDKHNDNYLNSNNKPAFSEALNYESERAFYNNHKGFFVFHSKYKNNNDFSASIPMNKDAQKSSHKYRIEYVQKDHVSYSSFCGMSPVAYIHFSKSCKNCQAKVYQALKDYEGYKVGGLKPAWEPIVYAIKPPEGSYVDNVLKWGVGAVNVDECRIGFNGNKPSDNRWGKNTKATTINAFFGQSNYEVQNYDHPKGRFPANIILDEESAKVMDEQSGDGKSGKVRNVKEAYRGESNTGLLRGISNFQNQHGDSGGASRFFYCAKSSRTERNLGLNKNILSLELEVCQCEENMEQVISLEKAISEWVTEMASQECNMTLFGKDILAQSQKVIVSITLMGTNKTMKSKTWNSLILPLTKEFIAGVLKIVREYGLSLVVNVDDSSPLRNIMNENQGLARGVENAVSGMQLKINAKEEKNIHPTCKPIALFEWLIKLVTREGQTVLDPFLGSGTTAISAHNTGRKCIGIEKEGEYIEIAKRRTTYWESQPRQMEIEA